jgi:hypothetical protein
MITLWNNFNQAVIRTIILSCMALFILISGCQPDNDISSIVGGGPEPTPTDSNFVIITGVIENYLTNEKLDTAYVRVVGKSLYLVTNSEGKFSGKYGLDSSQNLTIIVSKPGYKSDTLKFYALLKTTINLGTIRLVPVATVSTSSGEASSIYLFSQSSTSIGVRNSGSLETGRMTFQVVDSLGRNLTFTKKVLVTFKIVAPLGGGEYISPNAVYSDTAGQVVCVLTSGTRAGTVQIVAEIILPNRVITSMPVTYAIHGGLPDQLHFSVAPNKLNVPGWIIFGVEDEISAYVGDKYSNPVRIGTPVYFSSTGGLIQGSDITDDKGIATVNLITAEPRPVHPVFGPGFAEITATTNDENNQIITAKTYVLFSGYPIISISPVNFSIPNMGTQTFTYYVKDLNDNPIASGNTIAVSVQGEDLKFDGDVNITMPDTRSKSWTQFSFYVQDDDSTLVTRPVTIKITSSGVNGEALLTITGSAR